MSGPMLPLVRSPVRDIILSLVGKHVAAHSHATLPILPPFSLGLRPAPLPGLVSTVAFSLPLRGAAMLKMLVGVEILLFVVTAVSAVQAKEQHQHPTKKATFRIEQAIHAKISALRTYEDGHFVSRPEFDLLNTLQSDIRKLIDDDRERNTQLKDTIGHTLDGLHSEILQLGTLQQINTSASQNLNQGLGDIKGSLSNPPSPHFWLFPSLVTLLPAILGALAGATVTSTIVVYVAKRYTKRMRMIESTLEFSKRFGELINEQTELNNGFLESRSSDQKASMLPSPRETNDAKAWWWRFFDLMVYEYDFFMEGLLWDERFAEWMRWRWYEYNAKGAELWKTCGIDYLQGWNMWKTRSANSNNRLIPFFDHIHKLKSADEVETYVMSRSPSRFGKYKLVHGA
jgi:hypothetical protein